MPNAPRTHRGFMFPLLPLHWGLVSRELVLSGVVPEGRIVPPLAGGDTVKDLVSGGGFKKIRGSGSSSVVSGSGSLKRLKGGSRLCP